MDSIFKYFYKFKNNFLLNLSSIEILFCVVILANSIVALTGNIFIWIISRDFIETATIGFLSNFFNSVLVIISGIITATFRTLNHILINFIVNVTLFLYSYYRNYYYTKIFGPIVFVILHAVFLLLILLIVTIWIRRKEKSLFVVVDWNRVMDTEIKDIYKWYYLQQTLCHIQILVAILSHFVYLPLMLFIYHYNVGSPIDLLKYLPWPSTFLCIISLIMIKGVREESTLIMIIFYIANCILVIYYIYALIVTIEMILTFKDYKEYYVYILEMKIDIVLDVISFLITIITMINSIICHKNFGKGLKSYILKGELELFKESYDYKDDLDDYHERNDP